MKIEISDEIAKKCRLDEREALILLAIALYKSRGIHGTLAGKIVGVSEHEFHQLLAERNVDVNYGVDDLIEDIKNSLKKSE